MGYTDTPKMGHINEGEMIMPETVESYLQDHYLWLAPQIERGLDAVNAANFHQAMSTVFAQFKRSEDAQIVTQWFNQVALALTEHPSSSLVLEKVIASANEMQTNLNTTFELSASDVYTLEVSKLEQAIVGFENTQQISARMQLDMMKQDHQKNEAYVYIGLLCKDINLMIAQKANIDVDLQSQINKALKTYLRNSVGSEGSVEGYQIAKGYLDRIQIEPTPVSSTTTVRLSPREDESDASTSKDSSFKRMSPDAAVLSGMLKEISAAQDKKEKGDASEVLKKRQNPLIAQPLLEEEQPEKPSKKNAGRLRRLLRRKK